MARVGWGYQGRGKWSCSYKRTTIVFCSINIVASLYVLHALYTSIYVFSSNASPNAIKYTEDQIRIMEESIRVRKAAEPIELIRLVKEIKEEFSRKESVVQLSRFVKRKIADEILLRLKGLNGNTNVSEQREALEIWRKEKLEDAKKLELGKAIFNSTISAQEAKMLEKVLESDWVVLLEDIGVWMPAEIINREHADKPEGEELDDQIVPGRPIPSECNAKLHTDYAGAAVKWGLTHHKESAADCCQACLDQAKNAKPGERKCNIWVYCPSETGCHSPDIYEHKHQECWLKQAEKPRVTFKKKYSESYRTAHPSAPLFVPWISGVVSG